MSSSHRNVEQTGGLAAAELEGIVYFPVREMQGTAFTVTADQYQPLPTWTKVVTESTYTLPCLLLQGRRYLGKPSYSTSPY